MAALSLIASLRVSGAPAGCNSYQEAAELLVERTTTLRL